jgi:hypothetical protein
MRLKTMSEDETCLNSIAETPRMVGAAVVGWSVLS